MNKVFMYNLLFILEPTDLKKNLVRAGVKWDEVSKVVST